MTTIIYEPQAQISTGFPYGSFLSTSGERYPGVPAKPKIENAMFSSWSLNQLSYSLTAIFMHTYGEENAN